MHLTLKKKATRPAGANILQQQARFDAFLEELVVIQFESNCTTTEEFNEERPHEARKGLMKP